MRRRSKLPHPGRAIATRVHLPGVARSMHGAADRARSCRPTCSPASPAADDPRFPSASGGGPPFAAAATNRCASGVRNPAGPPPFVLHRAPRARGRPADRRHRRDAPQPDRRISDAGGTSDCPGRLVRGEGEPPTGDQRGRRGLRRPRRDVRALLGARSRATPSTAPELPLDATVHYGDDYDNAFWNGERMVFGDGDGEVFGGFTRSLTVIGHELDPRRHRAHGRPALPGPVRRAQRARLRRVRRACRAVRARARTPNRRAG